MRGVRQRHTDRHTVVTLHHTLHHDARNAGDRPDTKVYKSTFPAANVISHGRCKGETLPHNILRRMIHMARQAAAMNPLALLALTSAFGGGGGAGVTINSNGSITLGGATPAAKKARTSDLPDGVKGVAVLSEFELSMLVKAAETGENQEGTDANGRTSYVQVLDAETATKFKGNLRVLRKIGK